MKDGVDLHFRSEFDIRIESEIMQSHRAYMKLMLDELNDNLDLIDKLNKEGLLETAIKHGFLNNSYE